ncbi:MAG: hypothetical protein WD673_05810 [Alphaproteobacteria bacterium]
MRLEIKVDKAIPRLAWCVGLVRGQSVAVAHCGPWVESAGGGIVEGVWSGDFAAGRFDEAVTFWGTGARPVDDGILIAASTFTINPVFMVRTGDRLWVSNSLLRLLAHSGVRLDLAYPYYEIDLMTVMFGLSRYRRTIPTASGDAIHVRYATNLLVDRDLVVHERSKRVPGPMNDFDAYAGFLRDELTRVIANGADPARRRPMKPLATISTGYDSPACAVLAHGAGCREAITLTTARDAYVDRDDSGRRIAETLGLSVIEIDPYAGRATRPWSVEALFLAAGCGAGDIIFASALERLAGRVVVVGLHGDTTWAMKRRERVEDLRRGDPSFGSMNEARLEYGFAVVSPAAFGTARYDAIHRITVAPGMARWVLPGTDYNRPIPRRIVEEAGVDRAWFGQTKMAVSTPHAGTGSEYIPIANVFAPETVARFESFIAERAPHRQSWRRLKHRALWTIFRSYKIGWLLRRLAPAATADYILWKYSKPWATQQWLMPWAVAELIDQGTILKPR